MHFQLEEGLEEGSVAVGKNQRARSSVWEGAASGSTDEFIMEPRLLKVHMVLELAS